MQKYRTQLYGFDFGEVAKKQGQDMLPSIETHCVGCGGTVQTGLLQLCEHLMHHQKETVSELFVYIDLIHFPSKLFHNICCIFLPPITHVCCAVNNGDHLWRGIST